MCWPRSSSFTILGPAATSIWGVIEREHLRRALTTLPDEQRRALLLASYLGRTAAEVAELEADPLGTAKTRIRTAMTRLRDVLEVTDER
jgi:RNA polymerase sigma-70 factor, ECF subfamily